MRSTTNQLTQNHALYGVTTTVVEHEDDKSLLPSIIEFHLPRQPDDEMVGEKIGEIRFQNGPIKANGVTGIGIEHLLHVVMDRLDGYQASEYACPENQRARDSIECAILALENRTQDRQARGVEGTSKP